MKPIVSHAWLRDTVIAAALAGILSAVPSTVWAFAAGTNPWEATVAAGAVVVGTDATFPWVISAATIVHGSMSLFWAGVLCAYLPRSRPMTWGVIAGALIAVLDILIIGRFLPAIWELAFLPQLADHLMFGAVVGAVIQFRCFGENTEKYQ